MSVKVKSVNRKSPAYKCGMRDNDVLTKINGNVITDVLDYRFYETEAETVEFINKKGKTKLKKVRNVNGDLGLNFDTYLMDKKQSCKNKCIFCFIDQLPKGLRESLYFKDDDSRLSFLFGNYITLTNISEHEIERIIKMHISPINISVHTTNPELRVRMMKNKNAGRALDIIKRLNDANIKINAQLVLCPGFNDGEELKRSLSDLIAFENVECTACVPVGLTRFRDNLEKLEPFSAENAAKTIDIIDSFGEMSIKKYGERRFFAADEFYLTAGREIPPSGFYGDFLQLENGVGMWALLKSEAEKALCDYEEKEDIREISMATGKAAFPLISEIARKCEAKAKGLRVNVFAIENNFFGERITVAGLVTATDIMDQLKGKSLGEYLVIPSCMLDSTNTMFLDSVTVEELEAELKTKIKITENDGYGLIETILN